MVAAISSFGAGGGDGRSAGLRRERNSAPAAQALHPQLIRELVELRNERTRQRDSMAKPLAAAFTTPITRQAGMLDARQSLANTQVGKVPVGLGRESRKGREALDV